MMASTVADNVSTPLSPLSANPSRNRLRLRARAPMIASAYSYKSRAERKPVRTTNAIERRFREVRRRTRPMGVFLRPHFDGSYPLRRLQSRKPKPGRQAPLPADTNLLTLPQRHSRLELARNLLGLPLTSGDVARIAEIIAARPLTARSRGAGDEARRANLRDCGARRTKLSATIAHFRSTLPAPQQPAELSCTIF